MSLDKTDDRRQDGICVTRMSEAVIDGGFVDEIIALYIAIFNSKGEGEWGEQWTSDQVRKKLFEDVAAELGRSLVTTWRVGGALVGFSIVFIDPVATAVAIRDLPPGLQDGNVLAAVNRNLQWITGPDAIILHFREMGIRKEGRGGLAPVTRLLTDPGDVAYAGGATHHCYWTSRRSRLYPIVAAHDFHVVFVFGDTADNVLMSGDLGDALRRLKLSTAQGGAILAERMCHLGLK
jgi:hypothetical protein